MNMVKNPVGTSLDPERLETPYLLPIFNEPAAGIVMPRSTPLADPSVTEIEFNIPRASHGPFIAQGWWAQLAVLATAGVPASYPVIWADPSGGVSSDATPTAVGPPSFVGPREGFKFRYQWELGGEMLDFKHHGHSRFHWNVFPMPYSASAGAAGKLTVVRETGVRFAAGLTVYLFAGLFGRMVNAFPPPFLIDSTDQPIRNVADVTSTITVPGGTGTGVLAAPIDTVVRPRRQHPTIIDGFQFVGDDHLYCNLHWQTGKLCEDWVPAMLFSRYHGGRLPAPILVPGQTDLRISTVQPLVLGAAQAAASAAYDLEGGSYGL